MVTIKINFEKVAASVASKFELLKDKDYLLRPLAIETIPNIKERIHRDGKASDNSDIGTYSTGYMRVREKSNRSADRKVIVSLTRQLENDYTVVATQNGYGIGFSNPLNYLKADWVERSKKKIIYNLATQEKQYISDRLQELVNGAINP